MCSCCALSHFGLKGALAPRQKRRYRARTNSALGVFLKKDNRLKNNAFGKKQRTGAAIMNGARSRASHVLRKKVASNADSFGSDFGLSFRRLLLLSRPFVADEAALRAILVAANYNLRLSYNDT